VMEAIQSALQATLAQLSGGAAKSPVTISTNFVYGSSSTSFITSLAPGVMALVAVFATTVLSILVLVREKSQGLLERLFSTPLRPGELVSGHSLSLLVVASGQSIVVLLASILIFHATFVGSIALAFGVLLLFALGNIGLGLLISSVAQSEFQAVQLIPFLIFPQLFFAGAIFPLDSIPVVVRPISTVLPLTYASDALRSILLRGWGVTSIGWDMVALLIYAALTLGGAAFLVRRQA
jgi:ABC-2 type transport system permease protein